MAVKKAKKLTAKLKSKVKSAKRTVAPRKAKAKAIPDNYPQLIPVVVVERCAEAIAFYKNVLGAKERLVMPMPDGRIAHAELGFGGAVLMLGEAQPGFPVSNARLTLYTKDCDAMFQKAVAAGATVKQEPKDQFYGDRSCRVEDAFGNEWTLMTHFEDVSPKEMKRRMAQMSQAQPPPPPADA
jgi:PhnB protein